MPIPESVSLCQFIILAPKNSPPGGTLSLRAPGRGEVFFLFLFNGKSTGRGFFAGFTGRDRPVCRNPVFHVDAASLLLQANMNGALMCCFVEQLAVEVYLHRSGVILAVLLQEIAVCLRFIKRGARYGRKGQQCCCGSLDEGVHMRKMEISG